MKRTKYALVIAIAALLAATPLFAGGNKDAAAGDTASKEPVRLVMWGGVPPEAGPQKVCDDFNAEFAAKGISVEYERFVNDDTGNMKLEANLLAGSDIDLYLTYTPDFIKKRAQGNMALDLTALLARDKLDLVKMFGPMATGYYIDGKPYSFPTKIDQYGIVINKTMFDAAGIPVPKSWTLDEFRAVAKKLTKGSGPDKVYGMFFNSQQDLYYPLNYFSVQNLGGDPFYAKGGKETAFTDPVNVKTIQTVADMMLVDQSAPSHADSVTEKLSQEGMFLSGKSAMTIGPWIIRSIKDTAKYPHDFVTAFAPYPTPVKTSSPLFQGGLGDHVMINPKSRNVEAAWTFLKWYAEKGMIPLATGGRVPSHVNFDKDKIADAFMLGGEKILDRATLKVVLIDAKAKYAVPSITTKLPEIRKVLGEELEEIYLGRKTTMEGLTSAKTRADAFLK